MTEASIDELTVSKDDFLAIENFNQVINNLGDLDYRGLHVELSKLAQNSQEAGAFKASKIYWLLADACSMEIDYKNIAEPFKATFHYLNRRACNADDFSNEEISFFSEVVEEIENYLIQARLADLVWLLNKSLGIKFPQLAIDAYSKAPLNTQVWFKYGEDCWKRALTLAKQLRKPTADKLSEMKDQIFSVLIESTVDDGRLSLLMAELLDGFNLFYLKTEITQIAEITQKLHDLSLESGKKGEWFKARNFARVTSHWYYVMGDHENRYKAWSLFAEFYVSEAELRSKGEHKSFSVASSFYEDAIQAYREIPHKYREALNVGQRLIELKDLMDECSKKALDEMSFSQSPSICIREIIEAAEKTVKGKGAIEALKELCNFAPFTNFKEAEKRAIDTTREFTLTSIVGSSHMSGDGRTVAKTMGLKGTQELSADVDCVFLGMLQEYKLHVELMIKSSILPAFDIIRLEHRLTEMDFLNLAQASPIVPINRESLYAKGLYEGFEYDFVNALHILVPQVENLVRYHLKNAGVQTTHHGQDGIEDEKGLSSLVDEPKMNEVFGEDLSFEIRALFCESRGLNLRNELAHGLVNYYQANSVYSVYVWWLCLKLAFQTFYNTAHKMPKTDSASDKEEN